MTKFYKAFPGAKSNDTFDSSSREQQNVNVFTTQVESTGLVSIPVNFFCKWDAFKIHHFEVSLKH